MEFYFQKRYIWPQGDTGPVGICPFFFSHSIELINIIFDLDLKVDFNSKILTLKRNLYDGGQQLHLSEGIFHTSSKNHIFGEHYCLMFNLESSRGPNGMVL